MTDEGGRPIVTTVSTRSITYSPESIHVPRVAATSDRHATWILCRQLTEYEIEDDDALQHLAEAGRVRPDDLLVNRRLDFSMRAKEVPELQPIFRRQTISRVERVSALLARVIAAAWQLKSATHAG